MSTYRENEHINHGYTKNVICYTMMVQEKSLKKSTHPPFLQEKSCPFSTTHPKNIVLFAKIY
jgi:hypothetical protein